MKSLIRGVCALGLAGAVSGLAVARLTQDAMAPGTNASVASAGAFLQYRFDELEVFEQTVFRVDETYVDPARLDWEAMFGAVLEATEKHVPAAVLSREPGGSKVTVEIGEFHTVLEVEPVSDHRSLVEASRSLASLMTQHVDPAELPSDEGLNPWQQLEYAMVNGMLHGVLDPHSTLLPPRAASDMDVENQGQFGGLGITVAERDGWLWVEYTMPDTPAAAVGLRVGDRIVRIDDESTLNMTVDDAVTRLRGAEGAPVKLEIARESSENNLQVDVVRGLIPLNPVRAEMLEGGVGYVQIPSFHAEAEAQLRRQLSRLKREVGGSLRGLVLDLRSNPGGFYHEGWKVADAFVEDGSLVSTVDREGRQVDHKLARQGSTEPSYPIAVLVDPRSASASEIVAGALRNNDRAVVVGQRTFGKGSVQNLHEYHDGSKLKLTVSRYLTPGDRSIQSVGIPSDIELIPAYWSSDAPADRRLALHAGGLDLREADLPGALDADALVTDQPAYSMVWLHRDTHSDFGEPDPERDFEVRLARDVLLAAPSWRRADILASASRVISQHSRKAEAELVEAVELLGLDWSDGPPAERGGPVPVEIRMNPSVIPVGEPTDVVMTARNIGQTRLHRLAAVVTEHDVLSGREFLFGRLEPGAEASWTVTVNAPRGYPGERSPVVIELHDAGSNPLGELTTDVEFQGADRPVLDWSVELVDGDGDGMAEVNERVQIRLRVANHGSGDAVGVVARQLNRSGKAVDLVQGNVTVGESLDADGAPCDPEDRGTGSDGCRFVLAAGEVWDGVMEFDVRDHPVNGEVVLDIKLESREDYDWAAIARAELGDTYAVGETLVVPVAAPLPPGFERKPPRIEITRAPERVATGERVTISGMVTDDNGLAHVMVYAGNDKVFHQGAGRSSRLTAIPFTADVPLEPGLNTLVVQAIDRDGTTRTESVVTWSEAPELAAAPK